MPNGPNPEAKRSGPRVPHAAAIAAATLLLLAAGAALGVTSPTPNPPAGNNEPDARRENHRQLAELAARMQHALYGDRFTASPDDGWTVFRELLAAYDSLAAKYNDPPVANAGDPRIVIWPGLIYDAPPDILAYTGLPPDQAAETLKRTNALLDEASDQGDGGVYAQWRLLRNRYRFAIPAQDGPMIEWKLPELASSRGLARLGAARLHLAAHRGDWPAVADAYEDLLALARAAAARPAGLSALVGAAITALANAELRDALALHHVNAVPQPADAATLRSLIAALERQLPTTIMPGGPAPHPGAAWMFEGEHLAAVDSIDAAIAGAARGGAAGDPAHIRAEIHERIDAHYEAAITVARLPRAERAAHLAALDATLAGNDLPSLALSIVASPPGRTLTAFDQLALDIHATRALLAILLFEAQTGRLPRSLAELVPAYLAAPPSDPWNADGLVYTPLAAPDDVGRRFLLYAMGADAQDNGGAEDPTRKSTPFVESGRGTDALYTPPATR